jgi:hypothetical protein
VHPGNDGNASQKAKCGNDDIKHAGILTRIPRKNEQRKYQKYSRQWQIRKVPAK